MKLLIICLLKKAARNIILVVLSSVKNAEGYLKMKDIDKYAAEKQEILEIFNLHKGRYGYRRILSVLRSKGNCYDNSIMENFFGIL